MTTLINKESTQHYANTMVLAENRHVGSKNLPTALNEIDALIDEMKTYFDAEYSSALDMKLENNENVFSVGTGTNVDKRSEVENSFTDVELSGNSLVNLCTLKPNTTIVRSKSALFNPTMKSNTTYTLVTSISNSRYDSSFGAIVCINYPTIATDYIPIGGDANESLKNGYRIQKITTKSENVKSFAFAVHNANSSTDENKFTLDYALILEGDWTNKPIPQYFEGLKSVGEKEDGNHKIEILSQNKNLVQTIILGGINNDTGNLYNSSSTVRSETHIPIKPNTTYTISNDLSYNNYVYEYDINKNFIRLNNARVNPYTFTTTNNTYYIAFRSTSSEGQNDLNVKYQIEEGSVATSYVKRQLNKKEISLNEPLRSLPNGIKDTIEKVKGEWKIIRRCHETILDGSEDWHSGGYTNTDRQELYLSPDKLIPSTNKRGVSGMSYNNYISNNFPTIQGNIATSNRWLAINGTGGLTLALPKDKLAEPHFASAKQWLSQNPTKVVYELETPIIENISPVTLQCWKNGTI